MKFPAENFFSKGDLLTFTNKILNEKLRFYVVIAFFFTCLVAFA